MANFKEASHFEPPPLHVQSTYSPHPKDPQRLTPGLAIRARLRRAPCRPRWPGSRVGAAVPRRRRLRRWRLRRPPCARRRRRRRRRLIWTGSLGRNAASVQGRLHRRAAPGLFGRRLRGVGEACADRIAGGIVCSGIFGTAASHGPRQPAGHPSQLLAVRNVGSVFC